MLTEDKMAEEKKKSWFRKHWILTSILIILVLVIIVNAANSGDKSNSSKENSLFTSIGDSGNCPKELVPARIKVDCSEYELCKDNDSVSGIMCSCKYIETENYKWADGTEMTKANNINFGKAREQGQNTNYLYSWSYAIYDKTPINADGTIEKQINYGMFLSIDPKDKNSDGYKIVEYKCTKAYSEWVKL
jgi:hypothetical protein